MKSAFHNPAGRLFLAVTLALCVVSEVRAQDLQAAPTPVDEKARQRIEREAKKAAEQEEKALRAAAEKERKDAEAAAREREKTTARLAEQERKMGGQAAEPAPQGEALTPEQQRMLKAEEKARTEAEKARKNEEDRARAQEAKDAERRRKDEERAQREATKAREAEDKARATALRREQEEADRAARNARSSSPSGAAPSPDLPVASSPGVPLGPGVSLSKDDEKRRRELVKQIEKARAERDRLNHEAEAAEGIARAARNAANDGQRVYEALATGLDVEDVAAPATAGEAEQPKRNRFLTKADVKQADIAKTTPQTAPDPLRIALDLKNPEAESRERAAFALASLGPDALPATRALMAALTDANPAVRVAAAQALGRIGPGAAAAIAPLSAALTDPDPAVKNAAQAALFAIQGR